MKRLSGNVKPASWSCYWFSLTATIDNAVQWSAKHTNWTGWHSRNPLVELREPSILNGTQIENNLNKLGVEYAVVRKIGDLRCFLLTGGHCLISVRMANKHYSHLLKPKKYVLSPNGPGFWPLDQCSKSELRRYDNKTRLRVLRRDHYRCVKCKREQGCNPDFELEVHHIRPWSVGGISAVENLVTLCRTCHKGLKPHFDLSLHRHGQNVRDEIPPEKRWIVQTKMGQAIYQQLRFQADEEATKEM